MSLLKFEPDSMSGTLNVCDAESGELLIDCIDPYGDVHAALMAIDKVVSRKIETLEQKIEQIVTMVSADLGDIKKTALETRDQITAIGKRRGFS